MYTELEELQSIVMFHVLEFWIEKTAVVNENNSDEQMRGPCRVQADLTTSILASLMGKINSLES